MKNPKEFISDLYREHYLLLYAALLAAGVGGSIAYYRYESVKQIVEENIDNNDYFINEQGEICKVFGPEEHIIRIYRNDGLCHTIEEVPGYKIKKVTINKFVRDNNCTIYVNTVPVIAKGRIRKGGKIEFNQFGEITIELDEPKLRLNQSKN